MEDFGRWFKNFKLPENSSIYEIPEIKIKSEPTEIDYKWLNDYKYENGKLIGVHHE